jgi:NADPH-dependent 7-cyano-7-deazaguanine reductase QueF-like protein
MPLSTIFKLYLNTNNSGISLTAEAVDQMVSKTFPNKCFC